MDKYFKRGFEKIATPELAKETPGNDVSYLDSDARKERQKLLELYESKGKDKKKDTAVDPDEDDSYEKYRTIQDRY